MRPRAHPPDVPADSGGPSPADAKRRELSRRAADLFDSEGYYKTTVADIGEAIGLSKASVYHYFATKDEILYWLHEDFADTLIAQHEARLSTPMTASQSLLELVGDMLEVVEDRRSQVRVFFEHYRELTPEQQAPIRAKRIRYATYVEDEIRRGVESGELRDIDPKLAALTLFGMCNWAYQWFDRDGPKRGREIAYFFWDIFLRGVGSVPQPGGAA